MNVNQYYIPYYYISPMMSQVGFHYPELRYTYTNPYLVPFLPCETAPLIRRQKKVKGTAIWTKGGKVTKCNIPWTYNNSMTVAVGDNSPYKCGQALKIKNLSIPEPKEILVVVVDEVKGFPPNKLNLHEKAFEALGSSTGVGSIKIEITPISH